MNEHMLWFHLGIIDHPNESNSRQLRFSILSSCFSHLHTFIPHTPIYGVNSHMQRISFPQHLLHPPLPPISRATATSVSTNEEDRLFQLPISDRRAREKTRSRLTFLLKRKAEI